jgi:hypothetical protein
MLVKRDQAKVQDEYAATEMLEPEPTPGGLERDGLVPLVVVKVARRAAIRVDLRARPGGCRRRYQR